MPTYAIDRDYTVSTADHGVALYFGRASLGDSSAAWQFQFVPAQGGFVGSFAVTGCVIESPGAMATSGTDPNSPFVNTGFIPVPFRWALLNGVNGKWEMVEGTTVLNGAGGFLIQVPANGMKIAIMPSVESGFGTLWSQPVTVGCAP